MAFGWLRIDRAEKRSSEDNIWEYSEDGGEDSAAVVQARDALADERKKQSDDIYFGTSAENSDAMKWLNENAEDAKDRFKTFAQFEKAWIEIFNDHTGEARAVCSVRLLKLFLEIRKREGLDKDAARKRASRSRK